MKKLIKMAVILAGCASLDPVLAQPPQDDARAADTVR